MASVLFGNNTGNIYNHIMNAAFKTEWSTGVRSLAKDLSSVSRPALRPTLPPIQWVPGVTLATKPQFSVEVKNELYALSPLASARRSGAYLLYLLLLLTFSFGTLQVFRICYESCFSHYNRCGRILIAIAVLTNSDYK
jgi:hypothetical protein